MNKNRVGETYITNEGFKVKIIEYYNANNCTVVFEDGNTLEILSFDNIKNGRIKNPFFPTVYRVVFLGNGKYKATINKDKKLFKVFINVDGKTKFVSRHKTQEEAFQAYKKAKEEQIKNVANRFKEQIDLRVYIILMNYKIK